MAVRQRLLVTGGAGYVGSTLVPLLLRQGYRVRVVDALMFSQQPPIPALSSDNTFEFIRGDLRERGVITRALDGIDVIIHLAALVGEPVCRRYPQLTQAINQGVVFELNRARGDTPAIFLSTSSVYSEFTQYEHCTEETILPPPALTLPYARSKYEAEQLIAQGGRNYIVLRPATAFGYSSRIRLDLLPNELTFKALKEKQLKLYHPYAMRTFLHVRDLARAIIFMVERINALSGEIFNVGDNAMNVTKKEIADLIRSEIDCTVSVVAGDADPDRRNFIASYEKIAALGFTTEISLRQGIQEMATKFRHLEDSPAFYNTNGNFELVSYN